MLFPAFNHLSKCSSYLLIFPPKHSLFSHSGHINCLDVYKTHFSKCTRCYKEGVSTAQQGPDTQEATAGKQIPTVYLALYQGRGRGVTLSRLGDTKPDLLSNFDAAYPRLRALCKWSPRPVSAVVRAAAVSVLQGSQLGCKSLTEHELSSLIGNNLFEFFFIKIQME